MVRRAGSEARSRFAAAQERALADAQVEVRSRFIDLDTGLRLQILEAGEGDPLVMLHGTGAVAVSMLPLAERMPHWRSLVVDRPGHGLSDPVDGLREHPRTTAVEVVVAVLDALDLDRADLVGSSGGGLWSLWTALDRPERVRRLVLVGGVPSLPGSRVPLPLRLITTPVMGDILERVTPDSSPKTVQQLMRLMGEGDTIVRYPNLIDALAAIGNDPIASRTFRQELSGVIRGLRGWRPDVMVTETQLRQIQQPTLLIWGDHDPVGRPEVAKQAADVIPQGQAVEVPTGHVPYFGEPERTAELIAQFLSEPGPVGATP